MAYAGIKWGLEEDVVYHGGLSRGVLYPSSDSPVAWNGLVSVDETVSSSEPVPRYFDGKRVYNHYNPRNFDGTLRTYTLPQAFRTCLGEVNIIPGLVIGDQIRKTFNLSYATNVNENHKIIHMLYNVMATPTSINHVTQTNRTNATLHAYKLSATPPKITLQRPTAHLMINSSRMPDYIFAAVEDMLYGSATKAPTFPTQDVLYQLIGNPLLEPLAEPV